MNVLVRGAGVAGLAVAFELVSRGMAITVTDRRPSIEGSASWFAGGMLAPWCERESAEQAVFDLGRSAADWWEAALPGHVRRNGTLVVAPPRDVGELARFADRTMGGAIWLDEEGIARLEPALAGRFCRGLFFPGEAHLDPREALTGLQTRLADRGVRFRLGRSDVAPADGSFDRVVDCIGDGAIGRMQGLRGVRGEMLYLHSTEIVLSRPVRLLHPRHPLYVVPRAAGRFMIGATMIESEVGGPMTVRSVMELLNAAYALHPAFGEARLVETGTGIRPAFADNFPRVIVSADAIRVNGLYRHGFLLAPAMAAEAAAELAREAGRRDQYRRIKGEPFDEVHRQW
ncbi:glycine oxidase ThiO [Dongia soli]|uniref:Glycine oxidase ThiO n=1 Tax=Dongia soli TaxID=600628 RepID=A0ABU5EBY0_9PROT|nr:glycine oxidase ThiO [Dongia soli]MDY0883564.1 glycine oxidase ThiO [Dongia soli]